MDTFLIIGTVLLIIADTVALVIIVVGPRRAPAMASSHLPAKETSYLSGQSRRIGHEQ